MNTAAATVTAAALAAAGATNHRKTSVGDHRRRSRSSVGDHHNHHTNHSGHHWSWPLQCFKRPEHNEYNKPVTFPVLVSAVARQRTHAKALIKDVVIVERHVPLPIVVQEVTSVTEPLMSVLGIKTVAIVAIEEVEGIKFFGIRTWLRNGTSFGTFRRYSDFLALAEGLQSDQKFVESEAHRVELPRKHFLRCTGRKLVARKQKLLLWLYFLLRSPVKSCSDSVPQEQRPDTMARALKCVVSQLLLNDFLGIDPDAAPQLLRSVPSTSVSPQPNDPSGQELQIEVPRGVSAGQVLEFCLPNGKNLTVQVPDGLAGGSIWRLWCDPDSERLVGLPQSKGSICSGLGEHEGCLLEVTVPPRHKVIEPIVILVPDGRQISLTLPGKTVAGTQVQMWYEHALGRLTVIS